MVRFCSDSTYSPTWIEAFIVKQAFFLLQVELNPVMKASHISLFFLWLPHKYMLKARWIFKAIENNFYLLLQSKCPIGGGSPQKGYLF